MPILIIPLPTVQLCDQHIHEFQNSLSNRSLTVAEFRCDPRTESIQLAGLAALLPATEDNEVVSSASVWCPGDCTEARPELAALL